MAKRVTRNYINNPDLFKSLVDYKQLCLDAENSGEQKPIVPTYIGSAIHQISSKLSSRPNFSGYSFREDMIMDGVENCLLYMHNFNPEKTQNPFAYFTQIIWYAFLRRIAKEKKQMYIKFASSKELLMMGSTHAGGAELLSNLSVSAEYIDDFIEAYEEKLLAVKTKKTELDEKGESLND